MRISRKKRCAKIAALINRRGWKVEDKIVIAHMRGEKDRALRDRKAIEKFRAFDRVGEFIAIELEVGRVGDRPGKVIESKKGARVVR